MILAFFIHFSFFTEHLTGCTNFMFTHFTLLDYILSQFHVFLSIIFSVHIILQLL